MVDIGHGVFLEWWNTTKSLPAFYQIFPEKILNYWNETFFKDCSPFDLSPQLTFREADDDSILVTSLDSIYSWVFMTKNMTPMVDKHKITADQIIFIMVELVLTM